MDLKEIWHELTSRYTRDAELISELWSKIVTSYNSPGRYYHDLSHLEYMMKQALRYKSRLTDPDTLMFSIFYHDLVYNPLRNDNEDKSAVILNDDLIKMGVSGKQIEKCQKQILASIDHNSREDEDTNYFIDFDLAILGASPELYLDYSVKIRKEYAVFNDLEYRTGRRKVIKHFLEMNRIYKTDIFYENHEQPARKNLKKELENM